MNRDSLRSHTCYINLTPSHPLCMTSERDLSSAVCLTLSSPAVPLLFTNHIKLKKIQKFSDVAEQPAGRTGAVTSRGTSKKVSGLQTERKTPKKTINFQQKQNNATELSFVPRRKLSILRSRVSDWVIHTQPRVNELSVLSCHDSPNPWITLIYKFFQDFKTRCLLLLWKSLAERLHYRNGIITIWRIKQ